MVHTLSLIHASSLSFTCNLCHEPGCGPVFHCPDCNFHVHVACAAAPAQHQTHFSHPHHLLSLSQCPTLHHTCDSCATKIHTCSFRCGLCDFDIHPTCVRAPRFIMHPRHPHPLTLSKSAGSGAGEDGIAATSSAGSRQCHACKMPVQKLFYRCDRTMPGQGSCDFNLHQVCATLPTKVKHAQHILKLLDLPSQEKTKFTCGGCRKESKGWRFHCESCNFTMHPVCATSVHEFADLAYMPAESTSGEAEMTTARSSSSSSKTLSQQSAAMMPSLLDCTGTVSHSLVPNDDDLEAFQRVLRFARELVKGGDGEHGHGSSPPPQSGFNEEDHCPTCLEGYNLENPKKITDCGHHFHLSCILDWMERSTQCPICRRHIDFSMLR